MAAMEAVRLARDMWWFLVILVGDESYNQLSNIFISLSGTLGTHYRGHKERVEKFRQLKLSFVHQAASTASHSLPIFLVHVIDRNFWIGHSPPFLQPQLPLLCWTLFNINGNFSLQKHNQYFPIFFT